MEMNSMPRFGDERHRGKRYGNGAGSGHGGSTSGRGHKGAGARTGGGKDGKGFFGPYSGVQQFRKFPKHGFSNERFRNPEFSYVVVNVGDFELMAGLPEVIDLETMKAAGLISDVAGPVKVLASGDLTRTITVRAHRFSASARERIEALGGKAEEIEGARPPQREGQGGGMRQRQDYRDSRPQERRDYGQQGRPQHHAQQERQEHHNPVAPGQAPAQEHEQDVEA